jgi:hypothetical protein
MDALIPQLMKTFAHLVQSSMRDREDYGQIWQMVKILRILQYWMGEYLVQILHYILYNIPESSIFLSGNPLTSLLDYWVIYWTHFLGAFSVAFVLLMQMLYNCRDVMAENINSSTHFPFKKIIPNISI